MYVKHIWGYPWVWLFHWGDRKTTFNCKYILCYSYCRYYWSVAVLGREMAALGTTLVSTMDMTPKHRWLAHYVEQYVCDNFWWRTTKRLWHYRLMALWTRTSKVISLPINPLKVRNIIDTVCDYSRTENRQLRSQIHGTFLSPLWRRMLKM